MIYEERVGVLYYIGTICKLSHGTGLAVFVCYKNMKKKNKPRKPLELGAMKKAET